MEDEDQIRKLLRVTPPTGTKTPLTDKVIRRARAGVGQRDTLLFAIVRIWTVVAELLAPIFAQLAARHAKFKAGQAPRNHAPGEHE